MPTHIKNIKSVKAVLLNVSISSERRDFRNRPFHVRHTYDFKQRHPLYSVVVFFFQLNK